MPASWKVPLKLRTVLQRVGKASVSIAGTLRGQIENGLLLLLAVENGDTKSDADWLASKITRLRVFEDETGLMNLSIRQISGDVLVISQFTLLASTFKGNRPSFLRSAPPELARPLYDGFVASLTKELGRPVATGEFGATMQVSLVNEGPVTMILDSNHRE